MPVSTITNTITDATGTPLAGVQVRARLQPAGGFRTADGSEVAPEVRAVTNASGVWSLSLERNSGISPANSFYVIEERLPASAGGPRMWTIQVGAASQTLFAALVNPVPAQSVAAYLTQDAADARYVQAPGSFGGAANISTSSRGDTASAGVLNTYARTDHRHARGTDWFTVCTSTTRPASPAAGQMIFETDTLRVFVYSGSAWKLQPSPGAPAFRAYRTAAQSIPSGTNTTVQINTERYDVGNCFNTSTFTFTVPADCAGIYKMGGTVKFAAAATIDLWIAVNTVPVVRNQISTARVSVDGDYFLSVGNTVTMVVSQFSAGAMNIDAESNNSPEFWVAFDRAI